MFQAEPSSGFPGNFRKEVERTPCCGWCFWNYVGVCCIGSITDSVESRRCQLWAVVFIIATYFYNAQQRAQKAKLSWCECEKYKWLDCSQRNVRRSGYLPVYLLQTRQTESKCVFWGELTFDEKSLHTQSAYEWWDFCTLGIHSQRRSSIYL